MGGGNIDQTEQNSLTSFQTSSNDDSTKQPSEYASPPSSLPTDRYFDAPEFQIPSRASTGITDSANQSGPEEGGEVDKEAEYEVFEIRAEKIRFEQQQEENMITKLTDWLKSHHVPTTNKPSTARVDNIVASMISHRIYRPREAILRGVTSAMGTSAASTPADSETLLKNTPRLRISKDAIKKALDRDIAYINKYRLSPSYTYFGGSKSLKNTISDDPVAVCDRYDIWRTETEFQAGDFSSIAFCDALSHLGAELELWKEGIQEIDVELRQHAERGQKLDLAPISQGMRDQLTARGNLQRVENSEEAANTDDAGPRKDLDSAREILVSLKPAVAGH